MLTILPVFLSFAVKTTDITFLHWNPHWQCFAGHPNCASNATDILTGLLNPNTDLDFANLVELELPDYHPPAEWSTIAAHPSCGRDWDTLFYNAKRWRRLAERSGCIGGSGGGGLGDRSFAAGTFQNIADPAFVLTVLGAHCKTSPSLMVASPRSSDRASPSASFRRPWHSSAAPRVSADPWTINASTHAYDQAAGNLSAVLADLYPVRAVLLADTNTEGPEAAASAPSHHGVNKTSTQILSDLGLWPPPGGTAAGDAPAAAPLFQSCCANDDFSWQGDRIAANFGKVVDARRLFDPAPAWALFNGSEFHKGVQITLQVPVA